MRNLIKRIMTAALILALLCLPAAGLAEGGEAGVYAFAPGGVTLTLPQDLNGLTGEISLAGDQLSPSVYYTAVYYAAMAKDEYEALVSGALPTDRQETAIARMIWMGYIFAVRGGGPSVLDQYFSEPVKESDVTVLAETDGWTFYHYGWPAAALPDEIGEPYASEYARLAAAYGDILAAGAYQEPLRPGSELIGQTLRFETTDSEGAPVTSEELFAQHEITMLNVWTSWCYYCIQELETLQAIDGRLSEADCAVVGLLYDSDEPGALDTAKGLMAEHGATYRSILVTDELKAQLPVSAFPTTYYVDREGTIIDAPIIGAYTDSYEPTLYGLLEARG